MPKLILKRKAEVLKEFLLKNDKISFSVGSDENNDLVIEDKLISNRHLMIERRGNQFFARDLKSAFGTYFNDQKIEDQVELHHGDQLQLGEYTLVFNNPLEQHTAADAEFRDRTGNGFEAGTEFTDRGASQSRTAEETATEAETLINGGPAAAKTELERSKPIDEMAPYYLLAIYGPYAGKRFQLKYGDTRIGRDSKLNDIVIRENKKGEIDPSISRRHATISYRGGRFYVIDKRSKTRTYVNQTEVPEDEEIALEPGDEIEIVSDQQSTIFRFVAEGNWDYAPPRKAGVWWVRYRSKIVGAAATVAIVAGFFLGIQGYQSLALLQQKPEPFSLELIKWRNISQKSSQLASLQPANSDNESLRPSAVISDFTGDGYVDLASINEAMLLYMIDGQKKRIAWTLNTYSVHPHYALSTVDLNGNDLNDILFVSQNGRLIAVDGNNGAEIFTSPFFSLPFNGPPISGDFDGDGWPDVAVAEVNGKLHIGLNRVLEYEWKSIPFELITRAPLSAIDLDKDGLDEILVATEKGLVLIMDGAGQKIQATLDINNELGKALGDFFIENQIRFPVAAADLNGDNVIDLAITSLQGNLLVLDGQTRKRLWFDRLSDEILLNQDFTFPLSLGDVNADGRPDVVVATTNGRIRAYAGGGENQVPILLWERALNGTSLPLYDLALADMNKDGHVDVVVFDQSNVLRVLNGKNGQPLWDTGQPLAEITSLPLLADFDRDSWLDIVLVSKQQKVYQYRSNSRYPVATVLWSQAGGQAANLHYAAFELPGTTGSILQAGTGVLFALMGFSFFFIGKRRMRI